FLRPESAPPTLLWPERRAALLRRSGADAVAFLRTSLELLALTAEEFFHRLLLDRFEVRGLLPGEDFHFCRPPARRVRLLRGLCARAGVSLESVALADEDDAAVSSTRIREAIADGAVERAAILAGRNHRIAGRVGIGARRGRTIGFPTANLEALQGLVPA